MKQNTNKGFKITTIVIIVGIILLIGIGIIFFMGWQGIIRFSLTIIQVLILAAAIFAIAYLFWFLFLKQQKYDVNYVNKQKLVEAGTKLRRDTMKDLYISGDKGHSRVKVGNIAGYARIQALSREYLYKTSTNKEGIIKKELETITNDKGERIPQYTLEKQEQDVFVVKSPGIGGIFSEPMVIRVSPEDHDELVGDVTLYGFSLIPIGEYWFLNSDHLDIRKIDYAILKEAERTIAFATLTDVKEMIDKATGIDARHKKQIEQKSLQEIPDYQNQPPQRY